MRLEYASFLTVIFVSAIFADVPLPGTQPEAPGVEFGKVDQCVLCHGETQNGKSDPYFSWSGGMMSQAARDPVFRAALAIANQDVPGVGEYCLRCHTPHGWLGGRSKAADGSLLTKEDLHGVSCDACHHFVDPKSDEAKSLLKEPVPGLGNAMYVVAPGNTSRGPYGDGKGAMPHRVMKSAFHGSSELCGTCHDISNPLYAKDSKTQKPYEYGMIERTFSEWELSDFAKEGEKGTCQACHFPLVQGGGLPARYSDVHRDHFADHATLGASTWVQDTIAPLWGNDDINEKALANGKSRNEEFLKTAAKLDVSVASAGKVRIRITNLTGHKLPTGYDEGRRMWINVAFVDVSGKVIFEIGKYGNRTETIGAKEVEISTLLDPEATRVYECFRGLSPEVAAKNQKQPGKSFHFAINDVVVKDNRIPPRGFKNAVFAERLAEPVGATYADGQYWDDFDCDIPAGTKTIHVRLMFQSVSWEYIRFLLEENRSDDWGKRLYDTWQATNRCPPVVMAEQSAEIKP